MPDPWGGDNMGEHYAPHLYHKKEEDVKKGKPRLPPGWMVTTDDKAIPKMFDEATRLLCGIQLQPRPEFKDINGDPKDFIVGAFRDLVHVAFNASCRLAGVEVEGRHSEITWEMTESLGGLLSKWIEQSWLDQEKGREEELKQYHEAVATVQRLRAKLGLKDEETS